MIRSEMQRAFFVLALATSGVALAQQYRWTDERGLLRYTDTVPPKSARNVQKLNVAAPAAPQASYEMQRLRKDHPVTLYTAANCNEGCDAARDALNRRGVPFKEFLVWDPATIEELKRVAGAAEVPALTVGRNVHRGFEQGAYDELLDSAGYPRTGILPAGNQKAPPPAGSQASDAAKPPAQAEAPKARLGPYDPSGLVGPAPKPGIYDPSGLVGPAPKPGPYDPEKQLK